MKLAGRASVRGDPRGQLDDSFFTHLPDAEAMVMTNSGRTRRTGSSANAASNVAPGNRVEGDAPRVRPVTIFHESAGAVVMIGGRCLVLRRGGEWVFPKGHLERDERPEDAAIREVREETGLEVRIIAPIGSTRYEFGAPTDPGHRKRVHWFLAESNADAIRLEPPFSEAAVLDREEAGRILTHQTDRELAGRAFDAAAEIPRGSGTGT